MQVSNSASPTSGRIVRQSQQLRPILETGNSMVERASARSSMRDTGAAALQRAPVSVYSDKRLTANKKLPSRSRCRATQRFTRCWSCVTHNLKYKCLSKLSLTVQVGSRMFRRVTAGRRWQRSIRRWSRCRALCPTCRRRCAAQALSVCHLAFNMLAHLFLVCKSQQASQQRTAAPTA